MIKTLLKKFVFAILLVFLVAQFFGPPKNEGDVASIGPFLAETNPPENVKQILKNACFDCHSNNTRYPWYNSITPLNYWLADHVRHGKGDFNVSEWSSYSDKKKDHKLEELAEEVVKKEMPLPSYTWAHKDAKLTEDQIEAIVDWVKTARQNYASLKEAE